MLAKWEEEDWSFWLCKSVDGVFEVWIFYDEDGGVNFKPPISSWTIDEFKSD